MIIQGRKNGEITFICNVKHDAKTVYLAGNFNQWHPQAKRMTKYKDGSFRSKLKLLPGQYQYKFIIDGEWHIDPDAPYQALNSYGTLNSEFIVETSAKKNKPRAAHHAPVSYV